MKNFYIFLFIGLFTVNNLFSQSFTTITGVPIVNSGGDSRGTSWVDYDNDGDEDLFIVNNSQADSLYENNGNGTFTAVTNFNILNQSSSGDHAWGDYNNDGWMDLFLTNFNGSNYLYQNNGAGLFTQITTGDIVTDYLTSTSAAWADYDNDGHLDLFVGNAGVQDNSLYKNNGNGTFTKIITGSIVNDDGDTRGAVWGDYDNDGYVDLYVCNVSSQANFLYHNNGNGTFTKITTGAIVTDTFESFGASWGDYNNDGFLDLYVSNHNSGNISGQIKNNSLFMNNGDGTFTKIINSPAVTEDGYSASGSWADLDSDGYLDIYVANSSVPLPLQKNMLFMNNGTGGFNQILTGDIVNDSKRSQGIAIGDYDLNGKLDVFVGNRSNDDNDLYQNNNSTNNWLTVKCEGIVSNKAAIGTKIRLKTGSLWQMREIQSTHSYRNHNSLYATFGTGTYLVADSLIIEWPSGLVCYYTGVPVNNFVTYQEQCGDPCDTVNISASYTSVANGNNVQLNDFSTGSVSYISYDMGDGNTLTNLSPGSINNYTYAVPGIYTICQYAYAVLPSGYTCVDSSCLPVTLIDLLDCDTVNLQSNFSYNKSNLFVTFQDLSIGASLLKWNWGDGSASTTSPGATPWHTYQSAGSYQVCLVATRLFGDTANCRDTFCQSIMLVDTCDQFKAGFSYYNKGGTFFFTDTSNFSSTQSYWDFGDGDTAISNGSGSMVSHFYSFGAGQYVVCLESIVVIDSVTSCINTTCDTITVTTAIDRGLKEDFIQISPNPTSSKIHIKSLLSSINPLEIALYDIHGRLVISNQSIRGNSYILDLNHLSTATYILKAKHNGKVQHIKILKQP